MQQKYGKPCPCLYGDSDDDDDDDDDDDKTVWFIMAISKKCLSSSVNFEKERAHQHLNT